MSRHGKVPLIGDSPDGEPSFIAQMGRLTGKDDFGDMVDVVERWERALERIAHMPIDPRPDGTFNYSRAALIQIAQDSLLPPKEMTST